jgi:hypothetical protein
MHLICMGLIMYILKIGCLYHHASSSGGMASTGQGAFQMAHAASDPKKNSF